MTDAIIFGESKMADVLDIPNKYKRQIQRKIKELKEYEKW